MSARRPWYGFLYYILGTRGSFFAWVVALLGVYVTWNDAVLFCLNLGPRAASVADLAKKSPSWERWVQVGGVEVDLASPLFPQQVPPLGRILIDREDPAAGSWRDLLREIGEFRQALEGSSGQDDADAKLKGLRFHLPDRENIESARRFLPDRALVVVQSAEFREPGAATRSAQSGGRAVAPPDGVAEDLLTRSRRMTLEQCDLVQAAVRLDVVREGLLNRLPPSAREPYMEKFHVDVASSALVVGGHPSRTIAIVCGGFVLVLAFLVVGLRAGSK